MDAENLMEEFPKKSELCGNLNKKQNAAKKEFYRKKKLLQSSGYPNGGVIPVNERGEYTEDKPAYLKRYYRHHTSKHIKKMCHKKFRRTKILDPLPKSAHKKMTEYWWELS